MTRRAQPAVTVAVVAALAGLLFATSATIAQGRGGGLREPTDLVDVVRTATTRAETLNAQMDALRSEVDELSRAAVPEAKEDEEAVRLEGIASGSVAVSGPGLTVTMDDAPASSVTIPGATPDDLVVHQQDIQQVINALWAGGAEAMTLMGERVIMTSSFRCSGNILTLHGRVFSPPYVIEVIGDPERLRDALDADPGVTIYQQYASRFGLGWNVQTRDAIDMPTYAGSRELRFAALPEGTDPLR